MDNFTVDIINSFDFEGKYDGFTTLRSGLINCTYALSFVKGDGAVRRYVLQRINTEVFKEPVALMENIDRVTRFIRNKASKFGGDIARCTLNIIKTKKGNLYHIDAEGGYWRAYDYLEGCVCYNSVERPSDFYNAGVALGIFQKTLNDYPCEELVETIKNFHNTPSRFADFCKAVEENRGGRRDSVTAEIDFFMNRKDFYSVVVDGIAAGRIPVRVTHNDTKFNNVMMDKASGEVVCLIDLDTVMPGSALYDFGDSIRSGTNTAAEDETDLDLVHFNIELFEAYVRGYLGEMGAHLTSTEIALLPEAAVLLTLECGMRFLADYLNGDIYFSVDKNKPCHNLDRARTQIKLAEEMEANIEKMRRIVDSALS